MSKLKTHKVLYKIYEKTKKKQKGNVKVYKENSHVRVEIQEKTIVKIQKFLKWVLRI